jgi:hypothetical protein
MMKMMKKKKRSRWWRRRRRREVAPRPSTPRPAGGHMSTTQTKEAQEEQHALHPVLFDPQTARLKQQPLMAAVYARVRPTVFYLPSSSENRDLVQW